MCASVYANASAPGATSIYIEITLVATLRNGSTSSVPGYGLPGKESAFEYTECLPGGISYQATTYTEAHWIAQSREANITKVQTLVP